MQFLRWMMTGSLVVLLLVSAIGFAASWYLPQTMHFMSNEKEEVDLQLRFGRIEVNHTVSNQVMGAASDAADRPVTTEDIATLNGSESAAPVKSSSDWFAFAYRAYDLPTTWHGGGTIYFYAVPLWAPILLAVFGLGVCLYPRGQKDQAIEGAR